MEDYNNMVSAIALALGAGWASGINLYAAVLVLGLLGFTGNIALPANLEILMHPAVMIAAGVMYVVEFFADKIPGFDTGWDTVHTFIRIPAGALLAAGAVGEVNPALAVAAGLLGGGMAAGTHAVKSGTRVILNTSPEPFTNWTASVLEDVAVIGGIWTALYYPWAFVVFIALFALMLIWLLPKLWRGVKKVFSLLGRLFGSGKPAEHVDDNSSGDMARTPDSISNTLEVKMEQLSDLLSKGLITENEYWEKKQELLKAL